MNPELRKSLEVLQGTPAGAALRALVWEHRRNHIGQLLAVPEKTTERQREYSAGAVAGLEDLYADLRETLKWGSEAGSRNAERDIVGPQGPQGPQGPPWNGGGL